MGEFDPDKMSDEELARTLQTMEEDVQELRRALQDVGAAKDLVEQAAAEGFDTDAGTVAELVEFVSTEMDADEDAVAELQDLADAYLQSTDAESLGDAAVADMADWLDEQAGEMEEPDEGGEDEEPEGDVTMNDLEEVKNVVGEVASHLGDVKDMLSAREEDREQTIENLERRLSEIEEEPVNRSLTGDPDGDEFGVEPGGEPGDDEHEDVFV